MALRTALAFAVVFGGIAVKADMTTALKLEILFAHNVYRCMHGVPLLKWRNSVAEKAQKWANEGKLAHSPREAGANGENWAWGQSSVVAATDGWYNEIQKTKGGLVKEYSSETGHYTQIVWSSSVELGCGLGEVEGKPFYVCQYSPPGSYELKFEDNVKAPTVGETTCAARVAHGYMALHKRSGALLAATPARQADSWQTSTESPPAPSIEHSTEGRTSQRSTSEEGVAFDSRAATDRAQDHSGVVVQRHARSGSLLVRSELGGAKKLADKAKEVVKDIKVPDELKKPISDGALKVSKAVMSGDISKAATAIKEAASETATKASVAEGTLGGNSLAYLKDISADVIEAALNSPMSSTAVSADTQVALGAMGRTNHRKRRARR